jgi:CHAT domain-containing protein/tetratricopeptide (TPR) repeat protein
MRRTPRALAALLVTALLAAADKPPYQRLLEGDDALRAAQLESRLRQLTEADRYAEALPTADEVLALRRRVQGADHWQTRSAQQYTEALRRAAALPDAARQALADARRHMAEGERARQQGHLAEAERAFRLAYALRCRLLGPDQVETVASLGAVARVRDAQGRVAAAEALYRQAEAALRRTLGDDHPHTASARNNLAGCLTDQGHHADAEALYRQALHAARQAYGPGHPLTAQAAHNLANSLSHLRRNAEAEQLYRESLAVRRKVFGAEHPATASSYHGLAGILQAQGKHDQAEEFFRQTVALCRRYLGPDDPRTASSCNGLAVCLDFQGKYVEAEALYREALEAERRLRGDGHPSTVTMAGNLAGCLYARGQYAGAADQWRAATRGFEVARLRVALGGLRSAAFAAERSPWPPLAAVLARLGRAEEAWQAREASLARGLLDDLAIRRREPGDADLFRRAEGLVARLRALDEGPARRDEELRQRRRALEDELASCEAELSRRRVYDLARLQAQLPAETALVLWLDLQGVAKAANPAGEHWGGVVRRSGPPVWVKLPGSGPGGAWTPDDDNLPGRVRAALGQRPGPEGREAAAWCRRLAAQRLDPLADVLRGGAGVPPARHLLVLPSGWLNGIPVEALTDRYTVSYTPSGTLYARLAERRRAERADSGEPTLLALGDPAGRPLPGTRQEVEALARLFPRPTVLLDADASVQQLEGLRAAKQLQGYRYLHFATHGQADAAREFTSALLLAGDGRLTARAVLEAWDLQAELVTLSACQSGLGRSAGGEGLLGFSQAFLLAGARSVVLSLWKVDDTATSLLMVRFYENLLGRRAGLKGPLPKAEALREAKAWLRDLPAEEVRQQVAALPALERGAERQRQPAAEGVRPYADPYYWSAFILIGDPN